MTSALKFWIAKAVIDAGIFLGMLLLLGLLCWWLDRKTARRNDLRRPTPHTEGT